MLDSHFNIRNLSKLYGSDRSVQSEMNINLIDLDSLYFKEDYPAGTICNECGSCNTPLHEMISDETGELVWCCSDTMVCQQIKEGFSC